MGPTVVDETTSGRSASLRQRDFPQQSFLGTPATAPGPTGLGMLRDLGRIRANPLQYLVNMTDTYGPIVQFPIPRPPTYLVSDAAAARHVLMSSPRAYSKNTVQYSALSLITGTGLLTSDADVWRRQRRLVQPAFHTGAVNAVVGHVVDALDRLQPVWQSLPTDGGIVDLDEVLMRSTLEIVGASLFGTDLTAAADRLSRATLGALDVVVARARVPISPPAWMPTPGNRRLRTAVAELDEAVGAILQGRADSKSAQGDMLDLLLAEDDQGDQLAPLEIRNQIVTFIVAGHETVASALAWVMWLTATHQDVQDRLRAEADELLGAEPMSMESLARLPYTRAVFDEAMRLYPPAWLITRRALADDVLAGRSIPAGALIVTSPYLVHRDPAVWSQPNEFCPERFFNVDTRAGAGAQHFWPFGAGPRMCIGREFAYVEGVLLLAGLARRVTWTTPTRSHAPQPEPLVTIRPRGGVPLVVSRRD